MTDEKFPSETPSKIPFQEVIDALLNIDTPFPPRFLYRLSDLEAEELRQLAEIWPEIPVWRRRALMEDVETLGARDYLLSFESLARFAVQDEDPDVRIPAVRTLWEFENPDLIPIFIQLLQPEHLESVRAVAATALGQFVYKGELEEIPEQAYQKVQDQLLAAYHDSESALIKRRALEALSFSSREEVPVLIEAAYRMGDDEWLVSALFAMGRSANERWRPQVMKMLDHRLPAVRAEAARAAGELEMQNAVPQLLDLLDDPNESVRMASIWSLSQTGGEGVRERLEALYEASDEEQELDYIESALDNLTFTEGVGMFKLFDFSGMTEDDDFEDDLLDLMDQEDEDL